MIFPSMICSNVLKQNFETVGTCFVMYIIFYTDFKLYFIKLHILNWSNFYIRNLDFYLKTILLFYYCNILFRE